MSDWLFNDDPNYDGQGKSRQEETDGSMRVVGCLILLIMLIFAAILVGLVIWIA